MPKKFLTTLNLLIPFLESYPLRIKVLFGIWVFVTSLLLLSLLFFRICRKEQSKVVTPFEKTPLYEKTKQKIDDFYIDIDRNKLTPWAFLRTGKMQEIKDYYGRSIRYQGVEFEGSPRTVFWGNFIEPFLEHGIIDILEQVSDEAIKSNLDPEICVNEAVGFLYGCISSVYHRMSEIDQNLRGKGYPETVTRRDVSEKIKKMNGYLQEQQKAIVSITKSQYKTTPEEKFFQTNTFKFVVIPLLAIFATLIVGIPEWIQLIRKKGQTSVETTRIFADVSKDGKILRSNNFPWKIEKSKNKNGEILYTIVERGGDATAISVIPDYPEYTIYESYEGMVIKFTCAEEEISDFTIKVKY